MGARGARGVATGGAAEAIRDAVVLILLVLLLLSVRIHGLGTRAAERIGIRAETPNGALSPPLAAPPLGLRS